MCKVIWYSVPAHFFLQLERLESEELEITTYLAKKISEDLNYACSVTPSMWGSDVLIASRLLILLFEYETHQEGLNLTHRQERHYIQVNLRVLFFYLAVCLLT